MSHEPSQLPSQLPSSHPPLPVKEEPVTFVVAVIAKQPKPGQSKTRLQPLFTSSNQTSHQEDGPSQLAKAMLCDVLVSISHCCHQARRANHHHSSNSSSKQRVTIDQLLFYAPPTSEAGDHMQHIVANIGSTTSHHYQQQNGSTSTGNHHIQEDWTLLPIHPPPPHTNTNTSTNNTATTAATTTTTASTTSTDYDSRNHDLSHILSNVVRTGRNRHLSTPNTTVILFGMDAPEIPMEELYTILTTTTTGRQEAFLCPAYDGGYVMLSIPPVVHSETIDSIFQSVSPYWSHPLTAVTQLKALSDLGIPCIIGPAVHDIDTPDDVAALVQRCKTTPPTNHHFDNTPSNNHHHNDNNNIGMDGGCCLSRPSLALRSTTTTTTTTTIFQDYVHCPYTRQALIDLKLI